ncbi:MAG: hypothetical protein A3K19_16695 [Lentisphaerae bacterium RIFOXYB12_FULL_65_16]|nr:MAG: hypothetical protein A3K18_26715 [Lentisphaerae bacterium RIFOXYA12_64_32]OGV88959.1 MAG: hypothetical protein A3K19_16695 [Lentisphaerae bacterium RIFOXYB12_FULL_65_16]
MRQHFQKLVVLAAAMVASGSALAQEAQWLETQSWSGAGTAQTEMFWVVGSQWRVIYRPSGKGIFTVAVYDRDSRLLSIPTDQSEPISGSKSLRGTGERYLAITGIDSSWQVRVEQYLTKIEEWHLTQIMRQPKPSYGRMGTWTGEDATEEYEFEVPQGSWQLVHRNDGGGYLQVVVRDDQGYVALAANATAAGQGTSWVHKPGKFVMEVKAAGTKWEIHVLTQEK